ncbi:MAG: hypothetical protein MJE77_40590 [Proteobacteria bacterium]|nr:hypothetical protein [Pseudomonadota bacterium]
MFYEVDILRTALELASHARANSPYYRELYRDLPPQLVDFSSIPPVDRASYWKAVSPTQNRVATAPLTGVFIASGGTTGSPKYSVYARDEWMETRKAAGFGGAKAGLEQGDRVANMGSAIDMYGSLIMSHAALWWSPADVLEFPMGEPAAPDFQAGSLRKLKLFGITAVLTTTSTICRIAEEYLANADQYGPIPLKKILCSGEALFPAQKALLENAFPGVRVVSAGHGSTDAGPMGFADDTCDIGEHRRSPCALIEIVDAETGTLITEPGRPGDMIVTNLVRRLMPVIRYPIGDRAQWVEEQGGEYRKYRLLGRTAINANLAGVSIRYEELHDVITTFLRREYDLDVQGIQVVLTLKDRKDMMEVRIATRGRPAGAHSSLDDELRRFIGRVKDSIQLEIDAGYVHPLEINWVDYNDLIFSQKTGKLITVIDRRYERESEQR